ncbi:MAG: FAD-dependent oxidoreductase [Devosia sp.]|nr:FAD-dependent oxidoreductase [Devosia sp.]
MTSADTPRIAIIGAGPAGIRAAETLVEAGLRVTLIDEAALPGGQIYRQPPPTLRRPAKALYGFEAGKAEALHSSFARLRSAIDYRPETLVWGARDNRLLLSSRAGNTEIAFDKLILATGAMDRIAPVAGWTQPGVYSLGGAQVVLKHQACLIGKRPIFAGTGPLLYLIAWQYLRAGSRPAAVLDTGSFAGQLRALPRLARQPRTLLKGLYFTAALRAKGIPVLYSALPARIDARDDNLVLTYTRNGRSHEIAGDAVALGSGLKPETQLAEILGCAFDFHSPSRSYLPRCDRMGRSSLATTYIAGDTGGIRGADAAEAGGALAALAVLEDLGRSVPEVRKRQLLTHMRRAEIFRSGLELAFAYPAPAIAGLADDTVLCRCENVTIGDLRAAIPQWNITEMNRLKAITRCGMGRCQGRVCGSAAMEVLASETHAPIESVGRLRGQIPLKPVVGSNFETKAAS